MVISLFKQLVNPPPWESDYTGWEGQTVTLLGQVYQKEYRISFGEEKLIIYLNSKQLSKSNPIENIMCEINISELPEEGFVPELGNMVLVTGVWRGFDHAGNPGEFDAANYYMIEGICARIQNAKLLAAGTKNWPIREGLYKCRRYLLYNLYQAYPEKEAAILAKMLLGDGSGLDKEIKNLYQSNGIIHILSISGLHITMLGMGLYKLLRKCWVPIIPAAFLGGMGILLYGCMTGFGVSAARAIGMYCIHMLGEIWGKTYDMLTAMGVLAIVLLIENPLLSYHSGFLLSFASVCGVGLLSPVLRPPKIWFARSVLDNAVKRFGKKLLKSLGDSLSVSMAVTVFTLPLQLYFFYKIPVYSVIINLLIVPFMSVLMVTGIIVMLFPMFAILGYVGVGILDWFEWICIVFESLPGHTLVVGKPPIWKVLLYYTVVVSIILMAKRVKRYLALSILVVSVGMLLIPSQKSFQITILDVGQGECICVQTAKGECYLFDCGSSSRQNIGEKVVVPFLQHEGIAQIDGVFLSHADVDHSNGLMQLIEQNLIPIKAIYLPEVGMHAKEDFAKITDVAKDSRIQYIEKGNSFQSGDVKWTCLHPSSGLEGERNSYSACFLLEYKGFTMLLTGDVEGEGEDALLQELKHQQIGRIEVLKVAHHGSKYSTTEAFLQSVGPKVAVISCGENNTYGHPHTETLERLKQVNAMIWQTPYSGAIHIYETSKGVQMSTYHIDFEGGLKYY